MGDFRAELREKGILKHILDSHTSIVRENMSGEQYFTRKRQQGCREIDHIMFQKKFDSWIEEKHVEFNRGQTFFPGYHLRLTYCFKRWETNEVRNTPSREKIDLRKVFSIKMKLKIMTMKREF